LLFLPSIVGLTTFSGTSLYQLLAGLVLLFAIKAYKYRKIKDFLLSGFFSGLLSLTRSEFLLFYFVLIIVLIYLLSKQKKFSTKNILSFSALSILVFLLIVSPWIIRNTLLFNQFTTIISHPWHELWRGNNQHSSGGASSEYQLNIWVRKHQYPDIIKKIDKLPYNQHFEIAVDSVFKAEVINFWTENPFKTLQIWLKRALFTMSIDPYTPRARNLVFIFFILVSVFSALIGLRWIIKNRPDEDLSYVIYFSFFISYLILITIVNLETRYQIYLVSLLHPLSGVGLIEFYKKIRNGNFNLKMTKKTIIFLTIYSIILFYLIGLYIEKENEYNNFKKFENMSIAGRIEKIEYIQEKVRMKLKNSIDWLEFHPGYIEDEIKYPFRITARTGDSVYKESNAENLFLFSGDKTLRYRYIIIYDKKL
jgi:hypothetical protein